MQRYRRVTLWSGVLLVTVGAAGLVAWVGVDRAGRYLGIPAAVAEVLGLALALYGLVGPAPAAAPAEAEARHQIGRVQGGRDAGVWILGRAASLGVKIGVVKAGNDASIVVDDGTPRR